MCKSGKDKFFIIEPPNFEKQIKKIDKNIVKKVREKIYPILEKDPIRGNNNIKELTGDLEGRYSYRVSNYRLIYKVNNDKVEIYVLALKHRKEVYK